MVFVVVLAYSHDYHMEYWGERIVLGQRILSRTSAANAWLIGEWSKVGNIVTVGHSL